MNRIKDFYNNHLKSFIKKYKYYLIVVFLVFLAMIIPKIKVFNRFSNSSNMESICQLATLKIIYHNVGGYKESATFGKEIIRYGFKQYWVEYDANIDIGIDCEKVEIKESLFGNTIKVGLPQAKIIGDVEPNLKTLKEEYDSGWFTKVHLEKEGNYAFSVAEESIAENVYNDTKIISYANERVKEIYRNYINSYAKNNNKKVKIKFYEVK